MKKIAVWQMKGGVGKTTITFNLGSVLANRGYQVLFLDLDPQADLSFYFDPEQCQKGRKINLRELIQENHPLTKGIRSSVRFSNISFIYGSNDDIPFSSITDLSERLQEMEDRFDYCLIDCHPDAHVASLNALAACDLVLVPILLDKHSISNLNLVVRTLNRLEDQVRRGIPYRVVVNQLRREKCVYEAYKDLMMHHDYPVLETAICRESNINSALSLLKPIFKHRRGAKTSADFLALAEEVINEFRQIKSA